MDYKRKCSKANKTIKQAVKLSFKILKTRLDS